MITLTHPANRDETHPVPAAPAAAETGLTSYARDLAALVCAAVGGTTWQASTRAPYWPSDGHDQRTGVAVLVDGRYLVTTSRLSIGGTARELFEIRYNGRPIPVRPYGGELPHEAAVVHRAVWRHLRGMTDECDTLGCARTPVAVTGDRLAACRPCATRYTR